MRQRRLARLYCGSCGGIKLTTFKCLFHVERPRPAACRDGGHPRSIESMRPADRRSRFSKEWRGSEVPSSVLHLDNPALVVLKAEGERVGEVSCLSMSCLHASCTLQWHPATTSACHRAVPGCGLVAICGGRSWWVFVPVELVPSSRGFSPLRGFGQARARASPPFAQWQSRQIPTSLPSLATVADLRRRACDLECRRSAPR